LETFFLDQAREIDTLPGSTELLFVNRRDEDEREIVYIGKLAAVQAGMFCKDIEVLCFNAQGLMYHFYAEYARLRDGNLSLHGVDRISAERESVPRYLSGAARFRRERLPYTLTLSPATEHIPNLKSGKAASATAESLGFFSLLQIRGQIESYGYMQSYVSGEILRRLLLPFSFLVLCLLSVAVGWRFRARFYSQPHWILIVLMPLFPFVAIPITAMYVHAQRVIMTFVLLHLGFSISLIVLLVLQGLLLLTTMFILAGQRTD
jgi:hypothetical protein